MEMFWISTILLAFLATETVCETTCVDQQDVATLNGIVDTLLTVQESILSNPNNTEHNTMHTILNAICNDPTVRPLVDNIEQAVGACPEVVQSSNLTSLVLGPLNFLSLLEDYQGVGHFCECVPALLHVLAIEEMKSDIVVNDSLAKYPEVVNLTVICMKTQTPPPVNFTEAVTSIAENERKCSPVLHHTTVHMLYMEDFIMNDCDDFSPESFSCAMGHTHDQQLNDCLHQIDQQVTTVRDDVGDCRRSACVEKYMTGCDQLGRDAYMMSVNFYLGASDFQMAACDDGPTWLPSLILVVFASIIAIVRP